MRSYHGLHLQTPINGGLEEIQVAAMAGRPYRIVKGFWVELGRDINGVSPDTLFVYRKHIEHQQPWLDRAFFSPEEADRAADEFIFTFKDSVNQHGHVDYVESLNETYPSEDIVSQTKAVAFDRAFIRRLRIHCPNTKPVVYCAPPGNIDHDEYAILVPLARECQAADGAFGYHNYWSVVNGNSYVTSSQHAKDYHMRWAESYDAQGNIISGLDAYLVARGIFVKHFLGESGPIGAGPNGYYQLPNDGWLKDTVWNGNEDGYLRDLRDMDTLYANTRAAREGRLLGATLFTSGIGVGWTHFQIQRPFLERLTNYIVASGTPEPPPPPPPPPTPEPNLIYDLWFDGEYYNTPPEPPTTQTPVNWVYSYENGTNYGDGQPWNNCGKTETGKKDQNTIPQNEWPYFLNSRGVCLKEHANNAYKVRWSRTINLEPGLYRLFLHLYGDWYKGSWLDKQPPGEPDHAKIWLFVNSQRIEFIPAFLNDNELNAGFEVTQAGPATIGWEVLTRFAIPGIGGNNGCFYKRFAMYRLSDPIPPGGTYKIVVNLLPQNATISQKQAVVANRLVHEGKQTVLQSADDAVNLVRLGNAESFVKVWNAEAWPDDILAWLANKGVRFTVHTIPTGLELTHWPAVYKYVTQEFGVNPENYARFGLPGHNGVDISAPLDTPIKSAAPGKVIRADYHTSYGWHVRMEHMNGRYITMYCHLAENLNVSVGQEIPGGYKLGYSGNTGNSTGPHLHFEMREFPVGLAGWPYNIIDPTPFLSQLSAQGDN